MIVMAGYLATRPSYAWDMMAYMAVALHDLGMPLDQTHDAVYGYLERTLPVGKWDVLVGRPSPAAIEESMASPTTALADLEFRQEVARDSASFLAQLPFFSVKPLYPALLAVLHATGLDLIPSGMIISALCYIGVGLVFYFWFSEWMPAYVALGLMALLVINPYLVLMARNIGPDMLSDFALLFAVFLIMHERPLAGVALLLIAITARPENILYAGVFICYLAVVRLLSPLKVLACLAATALLYLVLVRTSGNYGWTSLLYYTFVTKSATPGTTTPVLGTFAIINMYLGRFDRILLGQGELPIFALIGFGALCLKSGLNSRYQDLLRDRYAHLLGLCAVLTVVRMAVLPVEAFRALLPCYMLLTVVLIQTCASMQRRVVTNLSR
jgi:hypothetical protein